MPHRFANWSRHHRGVHVLQQLVIGVQHVREVTEEQLAGTSAGNSLKLQLGLVRQTVRIGGAGGGHRGAVVCDENSKK